MGAILEYFRTTGESLKKTSGVYAIIHRDTGMLYVGSSSDMRARVSAHLHAAQNGIMLPLYRGIRALGAPAFDFEILERCPPDMNKTRENFYLAFLGATSADGLNVESKSTVAYGKKVSESTRQRIGAANRGRRRGPITPAALVNMRMAQLGRKNTPEAIEKTAAAKRGKPRDFATREKLRLANTGKKQSAETIAKRTEKLVGRKRSAETIEKIRAAKLGVPRSAETIAKMTGWKHTPESLHKMRQPRKKTAR